MKETAVTITGVSKRYNLGKTVDNKLSSILTNIIKRKPKEESFWALKDISIQVNKGDVVGVVGKNGAGKSTLLKILSQITRPTEGRIEIKGRVASLLEVGTGFHAELTGRENIFLNGTILGMSRKEVKDKFEDIVTFSGVEKFIDTPVKHYSSGMYVRLAFAVAAYLEPEILIIDEVLAVGDASFQKKCLGKMGDIAKNGRTVIFVSHDMGAVASLCTRGVLLDRGTVLFEGSVDQVIDKYMSSSNEILENAEKYKLRNYSEWDEKIILHNVCIISENGNPITNFSIDEKVGILIDFEVLNDKDINPVPNIHISHGLGGKIACSVNPFNNNSYSKKGLYSTVAWIPKNYFNNGYFNLGVAISTLDPVKVHVADYDALSFEVIDNLESTSRNGFAGKMDGYTRPIWQWENKNKNK